MNNLTQYGDFAKENTVIHSKAVNGKRKYIPKNLTGCILYLPMDSFQYGLTVDLSGYNKHGTPYGVTGVDAKVNKGLSFDGIDDYVDCGNATFFNIRQVTLMAWVKVIGHSSDNRWGRIIEKLYSNSYYLGLNENETKFKACFADPTYPYGTLESTTTINYGTWYFVAATHDEINDCLYINGVLESTRPNTTILSNSVQSLYLGKMTSVSTHIFKGIIDEARVYNVALSDTDILAAYQQEV